MKKIMLLTILLLNIILYNKCNDNPNKVNNSNDLYGQFDFGIVTNYSNNFGYLERGFSSVTPEGGYIYKTKEPNNLIFGGNFHVNDYNSSNIPISKNYIYKFLLDTDGIDTNFRFECYGKRVKFVLDGNNDYNINRIEKTIQMPPRIDLIGLEPNDVIPSISKGFLIKWKKDDNDVNGVCIMIQKIFNLDSSISFPFIYIKDGGEYFIDLKTLGFVVSNTILIEIIRLNSTFYIDDYHRIKLDIINCFDMRLMLKD